ncbi:hypothetical protein C1645_827510 [Glomus cerebriforme]|uniref:F-box domain-containing protein n=1 Tax=Glomus cerebriforme TaxID=658196 RepID=A0A397SSQ2_9GLOM|nr:hypothetical protein C1645_827510 [Glomus cerebriforme]
MSTQILNIDIIYEIVNQLKDNSFSLFNFLLVNKQICQIAVSLLWKNPFKFCKFNINIDYKCYSIIQIYITCFNEEERTKINSIFDKVNFSTEFTKSYDKTLLFEYGKYLKEFKFHELEKSISIWYNTINTTNDKSYLATKFKKCIMHSIMRQCKKLNCMEWNVLFMDEYKLETMNHKFTELENLSLVFDNRKNKKINSNFKNCCQNLFSLTFDYLDFAKSYLRKNHLDNVKILTNEVMSLVELQHDLKEFIFDHRYSEENEEEKIEYDKYFDDMITFILELRANSLTKVLLYFVDFNNISFDFIEKCINLEILGLRHNKGLSLENIDPYTTFKNLKLLDLSYNEWSSEINILIIKKAEDNLTSLIIGEGINNRIINDDTLIILTKYCPKLNSLSFSKISKKHLNMVFSYIININLITLQFDQIRVGGTVMKSENFLNYIKFQTSLLNLGIGKNDDYWHYYNKSRINFEKLMKQNNIRIIGYRPDDLKVKRFL